MFTLKCRKRYFGTAEPVFFGHPRIIFKRETGAVYWVHITRGVDQNVDLDMNCDI